MHALGHQTTSNGNLIFGGHAIFQLGVDAVQVGNVMSVIECVAVGVFACGNQSSALGFANLNGVVFHNLLLCVVFAHASSLY